MKGLSHCFIKLQASKLTVSVTTRSVLDDFNMGSLTIWKATLYVTINSYMTDNSSTIVHDKCSLKFIIWLLITLENDTVV